jgi:hypothetical protein
MSSLISLTTDWKIDFKLSLSYVSLPRHVARGTRIYLDIVTASASRPKLGSGVNFAPGNVTRYVAGPLKL